MNNDDYDVLKKFHEGKLTDGYKFFGCQFNGEQATFRVYAPRAQKVSVVGDFNNWDVNNAVMNCNDGVWHLTLNIPKFCAYKYAITNNGKTVLKADPYAFHGETNGSTASKAVGLTAYSWTDSAWEAEKRTYNPDNFNKPVNIYEAHIGSWRKYSDGNYFSYVKFADEICPYLKDMNYTHLELMGIAEYPFDGSWGYQVTSYYAPTSRYGTPDDLKYLINKCHEYGIGVIMDWVPGHFPKDEHGLYEFDGYPLYEPEDELKKEHKEWGTRCFDYGRPQVQSFLISNAHYFISQFHFDGLRVDAVASMLYLDYNRREWRPNKYGGNENLDAIEFFRTLNSLILSEFPCAFMVAEESTAFPMVTKPPHMGGLGFNYKWNMGWMNDSLAYAKTDPYFRQGNHNNLTFSLSYAFSENYILPISHDEVVHGKGSLLNKMPGDYDTKFAGYRNYLMNMVAHPGKKLTFMGTEIAQFAEWNFAKEIEWGLLAFPRHLESQNFVRELNRIYKTVPAFYQQDDSWQGYEWLVADDNANNVVAYQRKDKSGNILLVVINFSGSQIDEYRFGANEGTYTSILSSSISGYTTQATKYKTQKKASHGKENSLIMNISPMSGIYMICMAKTVKPKKGKTGRVI